MSQVKARTFFDKNAPDIAARSLFQKYDVNDDEFLSRSELSVLFENDLGLTSDQSEAYSLLLDKNGDGLVSFQEFQSWLKSGENFLNIADKTRYNLLRRAVKMFKQFDTDGNQSLDRQEFADFFRSVAGDPSKEEAAYRELDGDGNNVISFQEFLRWLKWVKLEKF